MYTLTTGLLLHVHLSLYMYSCGGSIVTTVYLHLTQPVTTIQAYTYTDTNYKYPADSKPVTVCDVTAGAVLQVVSRLED